MKFHKISLSVGAAVLIAAGVTLGAHSAANAAVFQNRAAVSAPAAAAATGFPGRYASAVPSASVAAGKILNESTGYRLKPTDFYNTATSANWSGYVTSTSSGTYDETQTEFTVPTVSAASCAADPNSAVSFWPGIDGFSDSTLEQLGITAYCDGTSPQYFAWIEEYPAAAEEIVDNSGNAAPVAAGDDITASVQDEGASASPSAPGTDYEFNLDDVTQNWSASVTIAMPSGYTGEDATSEVIAEAPTNGDTGFLFPLANFGTVDFTSSEYNSGTPLTSSNSTAYNMADSALLDTTGSIDSSGDFDVTYDDSDTITTPTHLSVSTDNISIGWDAVSGATEYEVYIDGPNLNKAGYVAADQTHAIYYDVAAGTYKYEVRAVNASGDSPWTTFQSVVFSTNSPAENSTAANSTAVVTGDIENATGAPATPTGLTASTDNISIGWDAVSNADYYEVYIDGPNLNKAGYVAADQTHAIYYDVAKGTYKYEVRTLNDTGYSPWTTFGSVDFTR